MQQRDFYNADGELLIVPQQGALRLRTEFGIIDIEPGEIAVIPRGVKFRAELLEAPPAATSARTTAASSPFPSAAPSAPTASPTLATSSRPVAAYEDHDEPSAAHRQMGRLALADRRSRHSPLDVVAWHGNYAPYKYDLRRFSPVGPLLFDHADPSIFTVLTSPSETPGTANVDFVCFPDRWLVAENTFRPPWYHMNVMSEFMGLIYGQYDAKPQGFVPGGFSLHNTMLPHGPDVDAFEAASHADLKPTSSPTPWPSCSKRASSSASPASPRNPPPCKATTRTTASKLRKHFTPPPPVT